MRKMRPISAVKRTFKGPQAIYPKNLKNQKSAQLDVARSITQSSANIVAVGHRMITSDSKTLKANSSAWTRPQTVTLNQKRPIFSKQRDKVSLKSAMLDKGVKTKNT